MHWSAHELAAAVGMTLSICAAAYAVLTVLAVALAGRRPFRPAATRAISVLKPLCGAETNLYESLRSFCLQNHPAFEIIFGVHSREDVAVNVVRLLQREFPHLSLKLVVGSCDHGQNPKVSNLINMLPHARHPYLVVADSDIKVRADYLHQVCAPLENPAVGIVTCPYVGVPVAQICSRLAAEFINGWFTPSVYLAALFGSRAFAFGATIALRREVLDQIGGFASIADELADDYRLGELTRRLGYETVLSDVVVETRVAERGLKAAIDHQLRWLRTIRAVRPVGYALAGITFATPVAFLSALLHRGPWTIANFALCVACRCTLQFLMPHPNRRRFEWWLAGLSELSAFLLWCTGFLSRQVLWRGVRLKIDKNGILTAASDDNALTAARGCAPEKPTPWRQRPPRILAG